VNILYIHTHDLGNWISPYGRDVETPQLAALAKESTLFTNAHSAAPTCSPSRAAMLTGINPHQARMLGLAHRGFCLTHPEWHIASKLSENGYQTALAGIQHEFSEFDMEGFPYQEIMGQIHRRPDEEHDSYQRRRDAEVAENASDWIRNRRDEKDFFLSVGFFQPHRPFVDGDPDIAVSSADIPGNLRDSKEVREDLCALKSSIRLLDAAVGKVIAAIKESGEWDRTIILFTTDHGIAFPLHKCCLSDAGTRIALMLRHPGKPDTHGKVVDSLVSHLDVVPTLYDWVGKEKPHWCEGQSLSGLIAGEVPRVREEVFCEVNYHAAYEPMRSIRTERYRLTRRFLDGNGWVLSNIDDSPSKSAWLDSSSYRDGVGELQLYDLDSDPNELNNLAGLPEYADVQKELADRLMVWMEKTEDPLLHGHLKPPPCGVINHRDSTSPYEHYYEDVSSR
jgi:arylsulfatase A-like enzyme